jgi:hypothetical protein
MVRLAENSTLTFEELLAADATTPGHSSKSIDRIMKVGSGLDSTRAVLEF